MKCQNLLLDLYAGPYNFKKFWMGGRGAYISFKMPKVEK